MAKFQKIVPCLWFDNQAEDAANFYVSIFDDSKITAVSYYGEEGQETTGGKPGSVLTVAFELSGCPLTALNGGPVFKFSEAISLQVMCADQDEIDRYWDSLAVGGDPSAQQCGWLKDRYGVSWQVVPAELGEWMSDPNRAKADRVMKALLKMKKLYIPVLRQAFIG